MKKLELAEFNRYKHRWVIASVKQWQLEGVVSPLRGVIYYLIVNSKSGEEEELRSSFEAAVRIFNEKL